MKSKNSSPTELDIENVAKNTLLPQQDVRMWLKHLEQIDYNRKRGAAKAALTRRQRQTTRKAKATSSGSVAVQNSYCCGVCGGIYKEETDEAEFWVGCDNCDNWYHGVCISIEPESEPDKYFCSSCSNR